MAAKLTRLTHKIAIQLHLVAETCTICSSRPQAASPETFKYTPIDRGEWSASRPGHFTLQRKSHRYPLYRRLGGPQSRSAYGGEEKIPSLCQDSNSDHPTRSPALHHWAVPAPLQLLLSESRPQLLTYVTHIFTFSRQIHIWVLPFYCVASSKHK
jgi:hypothetical protein